MTKHTPGPWQVKRSYDEMGRPNGYEVITVTDSGQPYIQVCCTVDYYECDDAEQFRNARLIAKAPETTDTLRAALAWWHSDTRRMLAKEPDWVKDARRILAEINEEGESMTDSKTKTVIRCPHCGNTDLDKMWHDRITADLTDEQLATLARAWEEDANGEGVLIEGDLETVLRQWRDEARWSQAVGEEE